MASARATAGAGLSVMFLVMSVAGCASNFVPQEPPPDHPASPMAAAGRPALRTRVLHGPALERSGDATHDAHAGPPPGGNRAPGSDRPGDLYACPMHPEVTSDGPGTCPKCGMPLEQQGATP